MKEKILKFYYLNNIYPLNVLHYYLHTSVFYVQYFPWHFTNYLKLFCWFLRWCCFFNLWRVLGIFIWTCRICGYKMGRHIYCSKRNHGNTKRYLSWPFSFKFWWRSMATTVSWLTTPDFFLWDTLKEMFTIICLILSTS